MRERTMRGRVKVRTWLGWCTATVVLALAACSSPGQQAATSSGTHATPVARAVAPSADAAPTTVTRPVLAGPAGLIGFWLVDATTEPAGSVVGIESGYAGATLITVWRACGSSVGGTWQADWSGLFVASVFDEDNGQCPRGESSATPWLSDARRYRVDGADRLLLSATGRVLARLVPSSGPTRIPHNSLPMSTPVVSGALLDQFAPHAPLPAKLRPATAAELVGRWVPVGSTTVPVDQRQVIWLRADGTWSSNGCGNGVGGRWSAGSGGAMIGTAGPNDSLVACARPNVGAWMFDVARAGFDGDVLVPVDRRGRPLDRLVRA